MTASPTRAPRDKAPALTRYSHFHIFGPFDECPPGPSRGNDPPPALVPDYLAIADQPGIQRGVVVQASVSGTGNAVTLDVAAQFGQKLAREVAVIDASFTGVESGQMNGAGMRQRERVDNPAKLYGV